LAKLHCGLKPPPVQEFSARRVKSGNLCAGAAHQNTGKKNRNCLRNDDDNPAYQPQEVVRKGRIAEMTSELPVDRRVLWAGHGPQTFPTTFPARDDRGVLGPQ
jgi:hypothetical protein